MRLRCAIVLTGLFVAAPLSACSDDGEDLEPYVDAIAADIAEPEEGAPPIEEDDARCAAEHAVDAIGEDKITEYETPEDLAAATEENLEALDLDDETLDTIAEDFVDCVGGLEFFMDALADFGLTEEQLDCVSDSITEEDFVASVRADLAGDTYEEFDTELGACVS